MAGPVVDRAQKQLLGRTLEDRAEARTSLLQAGVAGPPLTA